MYITATQAAAITALYYLYTGKVLSRSNALALIPMFAAQAVGSNLFLWVKSFLPPTGPLDAAAAGVAMAVTAAVLLTVNSLLASGAELHEGAKLKKRYRELERTLRQTVRSASWREVVTAAFWQRVIHDLMYA